MKRRRIEETTEKKKKKKKVRQFFPFILAIKHKNFIFCSVSIFVLSIGLEIKISQKKKKMLQHISKIYLNIILFLPFRFPSIK